MDILYTKAEVRAFTAAHHKAGRTVGFVPTMGYLHAGHTALMIEAGQRTDAVLASIFVNPTQFGPDEDFESYPRDADSDLAQAEAAGCAAVFMPSVAEMYPPDAQTTVQVPALAEGLCGASRPTHFTGVCTVVLKLFNITQCDVAVFGQKDYQQLAIIRQMVRDLDLDVEIVGAPIVREPDGLAMSSRNARLTPIQRWGAVCLSEGIRDAVGLWGTGCRDPQVLLAAAHVPITRTEDTKIDYIELRDTKTLALLTAPITGPAVLVMAVRLGGVRLIDNQIMR